MERICSWPAEPSRGARSGSLFASNISSTTLIGLAGDAYRTGIAVSNYEWMAGVVLVFIAIFFVPFFIRSKLTTIPEYLEKRFDVRSRKYFSGLTIFGSGPVVCWYLG